MEIPEPLFASFHQFFKDTQVNLRGIRALMRSFAEEEVLMFQSQKILFSSITLRNGTPITPVLLFCQELGVNCTNIHRFVEDSRKKRLNDSINEAVGAKRQSVENPNTSVVGETMKLLAKNSCGSQSMKHSPHTIKRQLNVETTRSALYSNVFKESNQVNHQLY